MDKATKVEEEGTVRMRRENRGRGTEGFIIVTETGGGQ
jgi:hypothetical protein